MKFSEQIYKLRKEKGLTQNELAERLFISYQAVSQWENGNTLPDIELLPKIAEIFNKSIDELFGIEKSSFGKINNYKDDTLYIVIANGKEIKEVLDLKNTIDNKTDIVVKIEGNVKDVSSSFGVNITGDVTGTIAAVDGIVITGDVSGDVSAGDGVKCGNITGNVNAGDSVYCGIVGKSVNAGDSIFCGNVGSSATAGASLTCGAIDGNVTVGGKIDNCGSIQGNVKTGGDLNCTSIVGDVTVDGTLHIKSDK